MRQLAAHLIGAEDWDAGDKALVVSVTQRVTQAMDEHAKRGKGFARVGGRKGVNVWALTPTGRVLSCEAALLATIRSA